MSALSKFVFGVNFDAAPTATATPAAVAAKPVEPRFSAAELEQARKQAYAEGQAAAQAAIERNVAESAQRAAEHMSLLLQGQEETGRRAMRSAIAVAVAMLRKLQPELARRKGLVEIESVLAHVIETMREEPRILVRVHDSLLDPLRERLDAVTAAAGFEGRVVILADEKLVPGDCRVEWADGGMERDAARMWREIDAALERTLSDTPVPLTVAHQAETTTKEARA